MVSIGNGSTSIEPPESKPNHTTNTPLLALLVAPLNSEGRRASVADLVAVIVPRVEDRSQSGVSRLERPESASNLSEQLH